MGRRSDAGSSPPSVSCTQLTMTVEQKADAIFLKCCDFLATTPNDCDLCREAEIGGRIWVKMVGSYEGSTEEAEYYACDRCVESKLHVVDDESSMDIQVSEDGYFFNDQDSEPSAEVRDKVLEMLGIHEILKRDKDKIKFLTDGYKELTAQVIRLKSFGRCKHDTDGDGNCRFCASGKYKCPFQQT